MRHFPHLCCMGCPILAIHRGKWNVEGPAPFPFASFLHHLSKWKMFLITLDLAQGPNVPLSSLAAQWMFNKLSLVSVQLPPIWSPFLISLQSIHYRASRIIFQDAIQIVITPLLNIPHLLQSETQTPQWGFHSSLWPDACIPIPYHLPHPSTAAQSSPPGHQEGLPFPLLPSSTTI